MTHQLPCAVVALNPSGDIVDFNEAARPLLRQCIDALPQVRRELAGTGSTAAGLPRALRLTPRPEQSGQALEAWLCEDQPGFALLFLPAAQAVSPTAQDTLHDSDLVLTSLIGAEVRHEIAALKEKISTLSDAGQGELQAFSQSADRFGRLLTTIELLTNTLQSPAFFEYERLSLTGLLSDVLKQMPGAHGDFNINQQLGDTTEQQGYLYGHSGWLKTALHALLDALDANAPLHCQIELRLRQNGSFIVLTGGYSNRAHHAPPGESTSPETQRALRIDASIRLTIARQIVRLHGGQLRVLTADHDDSGHELIESFTLVLPTSIPAQGRSPAACGQCIYPQQARMLAQDLVHLLPRQPLHPLSQDELQCLAHLTRETASLDMAQRSRS